MNGALVGDLTFPLLANFTLHIWTKILETVICMKLQLWQIIDNHYGISCLFNQFMLTLE